METNRDEILVNFQACSGIEDLNECIVRLEQCDWDMNNALNSFFSASLEFGGESGVELGHVDESIVNERLGLSIVGSSIDHVATSTTCLVEYDDIVYPIQVPSSASVSVLKTVIEQHCGVPSSDQILSGLPNTAVNGTLLRSLDLGHSPKFQLLKRCVSEFSLPTCHTNLLSQRLGLDFTIDVKNTDDNEEYTLHCKGSDTIAKTKEDISFATSIPVSRQRWSGWPDSNLNDVMTLAQTSIPQLNQKLLVSQTLSSSDEEYIDACETFPGDDERFGTVEKSSSNAALLPDVWTTEQEATDHFTKQFEIRYGDVRPMFVVGSLGEAALETNGAVPLAIYLHHDGSVVHNVFCTQVLCSGPIVSLLSNNFIIWGWDVTKGMDSFLSIFTSHLGSVSTEDFKYFEVDHFPLLVILLIKRYSKSPELLKVLKPCVCVDEYMTSLNNSYELFNIRNQQLFEEEFERTARQAERDLQDHAYQESMNADREKLRLKELHETSKKEDKARTMQMELDKQTAIRDVALRVPTEPPTECPAPISHLKFRFPRESEYEMQRRFLSSDTLQSVLDFVSSEGYLEKEYFVFTSYPRRNLTLDDGKHKTLLELGIRQQNLIVEKRYTGAGEESD